MSIPSLPTDRLTASVELVAEFCRVSPEWLRAEIRAGRIPHLRAAERILLDPKAVEAALLDRARKIPGEPEGGGEGGQP